MSRVSMCCGRKALSRVCAGAFVAVSLFAAGFTCSILSSLDVRAQDAAAATSNTGAGKASPAVTVQLNKLEEVKDGCSFSFVLSNKTKKTFKTLKLDLIIFRTDGVISKRVFADFAPLRVESSMKVKQLFFDDIKCSEVGSLLVNEIPECRDEDGVVDGCFSRVAFSHLGKVSLSK